MIFESTCRGIPTITKLKMQKMESASHGIKMNMKTLPLTYALPMPLRSFDAAESFKEYDIKIKRHVTREKQFTQRIYKFFKKKLEEKGEGWYFLRGPYRKTETARVT